MDTGIYVALSREIGIFQDMNVTANNIANSTTTGYQADNVLFSDYLTTATPLERSVAFSNDAATYRNTEQGTMQVTNAPLDVAIEGSGYFVVQTPLGTRYTRNGNFKVNPAGTLVTSEGYPVLDDSNQQILFDDTDKVVQVREDGTINVDNSPRAVIKVVQFNNEQVLQHTGGNLYAADAPAKPAENFQVVAGMLERSNVNPFTAMTHMMYVSRSIADTANFISTMYALERKASDTLAKIYS